jgi:hypothetical protein
MADVRLALQMILRQHDPFGAVVVNRRWDVIMASEAWVGFTAEVSPGACTAPPLTVIPSPRPNLMRMLFAPGGLRAAIRNWDVVARAALVRARRDAAGDPAAEEIVRTALQEGGVPEMWDDADLVTPQSLLIPVEIEMRGHLVRLLSTISTLGTAQDITLQELHIESFHPADAQTDALLRGMAGASS